MGGFSGMFWLMGLLPLLGIAAIAAVVWFGVRRAKSAPAPVAQEAATEQAQALRRLAHIAYGLYAAALIFPVTAFAGLVLAYLKRGEAAGGWLEGHFRWLIRSFWFMALWTVIGFATFFLFGLGWLILVAAGLWFIYRVVFGWVSLAERRAVPA